MVSVDMFARQHGLNPVKVEDNPAEENYNRVTFIEEVRDCIYVPELKAYVGEDILKIDERVRRAAEGIVDLSEKEDGEFLKEIGFEESWQILGNLKRRMLRLDEFWPFYKYCLTFRRDIIENALKDGVYQEWLDCLIERFSETYLITNLDKKIKVDMALDGRAFNWDQIDEKTGLPLSAQEDGEIRYIPPEKNLAITAAYIYHFCDKRLVLSFMDPPKHRYHLRGVREVMDARRF